MVKVDVSVFPSWEPIFASIGSWCGIIASKLKNGMDFMLASASTKEKSIRYYEENKRIVMKAQKELHDLNAISIQCPGNSSISHQIRACLKERDIAKEKLKKWRNHFQHMGWEEPNTSLTRQDEAEIDAMRNDFLKIAANVGKVITLPDKNTGIDID